MNDDQTQHRPICRIAADIRRKWGAKVYFGAVPYLDAMRSLSTNADAYGLDSADDILLHFFCNASAFRGEDAKALKWELAQHLSPAYASIAKKYKPKT